MRNYPFVPFAFLMAFLMLLFEPTPQPKPTPTYSTAPRPELIGQQIPITYTSKETGHQFSGMLTITYARDGKFLGDIGTIVSGNVIVPMSSNCQGDISYVGGSPLASIYTSPTKKILIGYSRFTVPEPYVLRNIWEFSCTSNEKTTFRKEGFK